MVLQISWAFAISTIVSLHHSKKSCKSLGKRYWSAQGVITEYHRLSGLNNGNAFSHVLVSRSSWSGCQDVLIQVRALFLACRWLSFCYMLTWFFLHGEGVGWSKGDLGLSVAPAKGIRDGTKDNQAMVWLVSCALCLKLKKALEKKEIHLLNLGNSMNWVEECWSELVTPCSLNWSAAVEEIYLRKLVLGFLVENRQRNA